MCQLHVFIISTGPSSVGVRIERRQSSSKWTRTELLTDQGFKLPPNSETLRSVLPSLSYNPIIAIRTLRIHPRIVTALLHSVYFPYIPWNHGLINTYIHTYTYIHYIIITIQYTYTHCTDECQIMQFYC